MAQSKRRMLSLVQIYRGIAVILILLGHANKVFNMSFDYDWFNTGKWVRTGGVDFFFIVSGFMMYYLYHKNIGVAEKAKDFLIKRIIKIYPVLWLFTLAVTAAVFVFPQLGDGHETNPEIIIKSLLLFPTDPVLDLTWSLSHVILFYLMFTLYIYKPKILKPVFLVWIILSILYDLNVLNGLNSFLFAFSNLEIMLGSGIAFIITRYKVKYAMLYVVVGLIGFAFVWFNNVTQLYNIRLDYFYCLFSALIMFGISLIDMKKDRKLPKTLTIVADSSYSIYIAQMPILHVIVMLLNKLSIVQILGPGITIWIAIISTIGASCVVYYLFEKPVSIFLKNKLLNKTRTPKVKTAIAK